MVKIVGAVLVVGSSGVIGNVVARGYSERPRQLAELISAFTLLETEISYAKTPLSEALVRSGGYRNCIAGKMFEMASCIIASGDQSPGQAWEAAVGYAYSISALTSEDRDALLAFGAKLGSCNSTDQLRHIALVRERLRRSEAQAREKAEQTARMWRYLGLTVGAMITLLLY
jgi:stage III sporulation protein AB